MPKQRRDALITHVEPELATQVKLAAERAGMTTSSYIRWVLREHVKMS